MNGKLAVNLVFIVAIIITIYLILGAPTFSSGLASAISSWKPISLDPSLAPS